MIPRRTLLATPALLLPRLAAAQSADSLIGTWTVVVADDERHRSWTVTAEAGDHLSGRYGWQGGRAQPVDASLAAGATGRRLRFATPANSIIDATEVMPGRFEGVFTSARGRARNVVLSRDELREATPAAAAAGRAPGASPAAAPGSGGVTVVYVAAWNCAPCRYFEMTPYLKPAFLASATARALSWRDVSVPQFGDIRAAGYWPADLSWVREDAMMPSRGTPTFIVAQGRTVLQVGQGLNNWEARTIPLARRLTGTA